MPAVPHRLGFLNDLNADGEAVPGIEHTNIVTKYDELVFPYTSGIMGDGGTNIVLQDVCPLNLASTSPSPSTRPSPDDRQRARARERDARHLLRAGAAAANAARRSAAKSAKLRGGRPRMSLTSEPTRSVIPPSR